MSARRIAEVLERSPSTITREIKRNSCKLGNGKGYYRYLQKKLVKTMQKEEEGVTEKVNMEIKKLSIYKKNKGVLVARTNSK